MKLYSIDLFNWPLPLVRKPLMEYQNPGHAFTAATHNFLLLPNDVIERPARVVWQSCVTRRKGDGDIQLQLYTKSAGDWRDGHADQSKFITFRSVREEVSKGTTTQANHVYCELSNDEIDTIVKTPAKYGLLIGVRQRSLDGITCPAWYSSKLFVAY